MALVYGTEDFHGGGRGEPSFLLTNRLGGYASTTTVFSISRCDQGILVAAMGTDGGRYTMVHRLSETLHLCDRREFLSTQTFADGREAEDGYRHLTGLVYERHPCWRYNVGGVEVERRMEMAPEENTAVVCYTICNASRAPCTLEVAPQLKFAPAGEALERLDRRFVYRDGKISWGNLHIYMRTGAQAVPQTMRWQLLAYPEDEKRGCPGRGLAASCCAVVKTVLPERTEQFEIQFSV